MQRILQIVILLLLVANTVYGAALVQFEATSCTDKKATEGIIEKRWLFGTLYMKLYAYLNCCQKKEGSVAIDGNVMRLTVTESGEPCECMCPFNISVAVQGVTRRACIIKLNGRILSQSTPIIYQK